MKEVTPDTLICEILENCEGAKELFLKLGYKCVDCAVNAEDSLAVAAKYHKKDLNELLNSINALILRNNQQKNNSI